MKMLYLTTWDFENAESDGVCKKIESQIRLFEKNQIQVDWVYIKGKELCYRKEGSCSVIAHVGKVKKTEAYLKMYSYLKKERYDWIYNRFGMFDAFYIRVLRRLKHNGARIMVEIPTYSYEGEKGKGLLLSAMYAWNRYYCKKIKELVDLFAVHNPINELFGVEAIQISNCIDLDTIPFRGNHILNDTIDLIAVALFQPYHGYERLLLGLRDYYRNGGKRDIHLHMVGDGPEKEYYESIVSENMLQAHVTFYGRRGGKELDDIFAVADIGICSLGCYKKGMYYITEIKVREYLARGIPFVTGGELDIQSLLSDDMYIGFSNSPESIGVEKIVGFYDMFYIENKVDSKRMRELAKMKLSYDAVFRTVLERMKDKKQ